MNAKQRTALLRTLEERFESPPHRHGGIDWARVKARLEAAPGKLEVLHEMERTGGEPDVVALGRSSAEVVFVDCSAESPAGRRSLCYDRSAWEGRKKNRPRGNALDLAAAMGVEILTEAEYRKLQELGEFDRKTSSWVRTPEAIRDLGGALFCDRRYGTVFTYHNGADAYYAARGFRAARRV